ncbi:hypothetical protein T11_13630 [Trichinella zimbabwensis]|uniref:Uncharacterized protein n=1 Tax=Trichinella zimbabwensis TaxID=268475 RepID=A0A0V1HPE8_9BILA|nr:hypothetical protein T11_13630 [Trichinella zimbabwensis]
MAGLRYQLTNRYWITYLTTPHDTQKITLNMAWRLNATSPGRK